MKQYNDYDNLTKIKLELATKMLENELADLNGVLSVKADKENECIIVYVDDIRIWVDIPEFYPKKNGYAVEVIQQK